ncbi:MAG: DUF86 domain-containing protein [Anaerolineae bacterium]|nr:DUF86 domain-containing protein [Anaerolineae bacterium]
MSLVREYMQDLLVEIRLLESFTAGGEQAFYTDARTQYAVMMAYARIGEIAKRIPDSVLQTQPQAEWREIKGFRDVLLHRYGEISPGRVWEAVVKLAVLRDATEALLENLPADDGDDGRAAGNDPT